MLEDMAGDARGLAKKVTSKAVRYMNVLNKIREIKITNFFEISICKLAVSHTVLSPAQQLYHASVKLTPQCLHYVASRLRTHNQKADGSNLKI